MATDCVRLSEIWEDGLIGTVRTGSMAQFRARIGQIADPEVALGVVRWR